MSREESTDVVEIDAIAIEEWEHEQHTPMANDTNLAALVKQSAANSYPVKALDERWDDLAVPQASAPAAKPRTTTNTLRRSGAAEAVSALPTAIPAGGKNKTMAFPTALVKPAMPIKRAEMTSRPTGVPKQVGPRPATQPGALAAGTSKPEAASAGARTATSQPARPAPEPAGHPCLHEGTKVTAMAAVRPTTEAPAAVAAKRVTTEAAPIAVVAKRPTSEVTPVAPAPKRPTHATPVAAGPPATPPKRPTSQAKAEAAPIAPKFVAAPGPAMSRRPTSELTSKVKRTSTEPVVAIPSPVNLAEVATAAVDVAPFEASLSSSDDWLPAWPPAAEAAVPAATTPAHTFEDWDDPSASTAIGNRVAPTEPTRAARDNASAFPRENSVIIDLGAQSPKQVTAAPKRPQTQPVIQTSEQSTTTSGVFVMPTEGESLAAPNVVANKPPTLADYADPRAISTSEPALLPERPSNPWQTPLPGPLPGEPLAAAAVSPFSRTASERALDYSTPTSVPTSASPAQTSVPPPRPSEPFAPCEPSPVVQQAQWPSVAGLGYDAGSDTAIPSPITRPEPTEQAPLRTPLLTPKRRRVALFAIGGVFVAILGMAIGSGGAKKPVPTAAIEKTPAAAATPTNTTTAVPTARAAAAAVAITAAIPTASNPPTPPIKAAPTKQVTAKRRFKATKPVVVDYDKRPESAPDADQSLAKARSIYANGNQRLFAGDPTGAIVQYRQALAAYPNYAASYRGIGLAYAQQANRPAALGAFKTYVQLAPGAKDVALIKVRIANLSVR